MGELRLVPKAENDLARIWSSIARHNLRAADRLILQIFRRMEQAADFPAIGTRRPELSGTARILVQGNYIVIYEPFSDGILVISVVHGATAPDDWL